MRKFLNINNKQQYIILNHFSLFMCVYAEIFVHNSMNEKAKHIWWSS